MRAPNILISGSIAHVDQRIAVLRISMNGSGAIPLKIMEPEAVDLVAWSFVGFSERKIMDPSCILVLGCRDSGAFDNLSSVSVCTHVGDRCVTLTSGPTPLSRDEASVVAETVTSSLDPNWLEHFSALIPLLSAGLDTILTDSMSSALSIRRSESADAWLINGIDFIPNCVIVRSMAGYTCSSITSIRFDAHKRAAITLTASLPLDTQSINGAILSGQGRYAVARVAGAM